MTQFKAIEKKNLHELAAMLEAATVDGWHVLSAGYAKHGPLANDGNAWALLSKTDEQRGNS